MNQAQNRVNRAAAFGKIPTRTLIEEVRKRPQLYNSIAKDFGIIVTNKDKSNYWGDIGRVIYPNWDTMNMNARTELVKLLRTKWSKIRSSFAKEFNHVLKTGTLPNLRNCPFYNDLAFLMPFIHEKQNKDAQSIENSNVNQEENQRFHPQEGNNHQSPRSSTETRHPIPSPQGSGVQTNVPMKSRFENFINTQNFNFPKNVGKIGQNRGFNHQEQNNLSNRNRPEITPRPSTSAQGSNTKVNCSIRDKGETPNIQAVKYPIITLDETQHNTQNDGESNALENRRFNSVDENNIHNSIPPPEINETSRPTPVEVPCTKNSTPRKRKTSISKVVGGKRLAVERARSSVSQDLTKLLAESVALQREDRQSDIFGHKAFLMSFVPILNTFPLEAAMQARQQISTVMNNIVEQIFESNGPPPSADTGYHPDSSGFDIQDSIYLN